MAKGGGLGDMFYVHGVDISGDVSALTSISAPSAEIDATAIVHSGKARMYGLYDGTITATHFFNDATGETNDVLKAKGGGADRVVTYFRGGAIGNAAAGMVSKQMNFDWTRGNDASLMGTSTFQANGFGLEYCEQITAGKVTHASATNGASQNNGAATSSGLSAYLQVFSLASGSPTVKIQSSSDNGGGDAFADVSGMSFGVVAAGNGYKLVTGLTAAIEQYLRPVTTGTFSNLVFALCVSRYPVTA